LRHKMNEAAKRRKFAEQNEHILYVFTLETIPVRKTL
jgi:hypothetical protein